MIRVNFTVNLRWPLKVVCRLLGGHVWQDVISIHPLMGSSYRYCKRCGKDWRRKCWFDRHPGWRWSGGNDEMVLARCTLCGESRRFAADDPQAPPPPRSVTFTPGGAA